MKISEVIARLEEIKSKEGDLNVCKSEPHEYWGSVQSHIEEYDIALSEHAQPDGPKKESQKAVVIGCTF